jgi:hypothetical protein
MQSCDHQASESHQTGPELNIMTPISDGTSHLVNALATPSQLAHSNSQLDGVPADLERSILFAGARITQIAGILLRLPQDIIAQAIVVFQRFWVGPNGGSVREYDSQVGQNRTH